MIRKQTLKYKSLYACTREVFVEKYVSLDKKMEWVYEQIAKARENNDMFSQNKFEQFEIIFLQNPYRFERLVSKELIRAKLIRAKQ
jgi:hypothetical protein